MICYICNQLSKKKEFLIYEMIKKHKSDLTHLHTLKCKMFIMLLEEQRGLKLDVRFWQRIHAEYEGSNQYCIYNLITKCTDVYWDVIFCKNQCYDHAILPNQWKPSDDLPDEILKTSNQENNENWVSLSLPLLQGQITHETAINNPQNYTTSREMLGTNDDKVIADENISAKSDVQDSCIEFHDVEFQVISASVIENSDQSEAQNSDTKQLELQLADELNQSGSSMMGYSATSGPEPQRSGWERRPPSQFNNSPQGHHEYLQMIMLLQVDAHMLRHDFKIYKKARSRPDWPLFSMVSDYKMDFINENGVWMKIQFENVPLRWFILTSRWVYKTKWNWNDAVLKHKTWWVIHDYKQ